MTKSEILSFRKYAAITFDALNTKFVKGIQGFGQLPRFSPPSVKPMTSGSLNINRALTPTGMGNFNIGGKSWQFQNDFGQKIMKANQEFYKATGRNFNITSGYRSPEHQLKLLKQRGVDPNKGIPGVIAPVGKSRHQKGLSVDIANWQEAAPYLRAQGLNNPLPKDRVHFQL